MAPQQIFSPPPGHLLLTAKGRRPNKPDYKSDGDMITGRRQRSASSEVMEGRFNEVKGGA